MNLELQQQLYKLSEIKTYIKDQVIVREGDFPKFIHILLKGSAKVIPSSIHGIEALIDYLEVDDFIGDIEYSKKTPYVHTVIAKEKVQALLIPIEKMASLLNDIMFCRFYISNLSKKLNISSKKSKDLTTLTARERFLNHVYSKAVDKEYIVHQTYEELAKQIGTSSRHLRRIITELKEENIIDVSSKSIKIKEDYH
jgi:CRP-like cAMP-binding protein